MPFFRDFLGALKEAAGSLKDIANLQRNERDKYRKEFEEAYILLNTTLNMLITKLGDVQNEMDDLRFMQKAVNMDNISDWYDAERKIGLCSNLRVVKREMQTLGTKLAGNLSTNSWDDLQQIMDKLLNNEAEMAGYISSVLSNIANDARRGMAKTDILQKVTDFRNELLQERKQLMRQEQELITVI